MANTSNFAGAFSKSDNKPIETVCNICNKKDCNCLQKIKEKIKILNCIEENSYQFNYEVNRELFIQQYNKHLYEK
jgi:hypothetical protein